jgi:hypothetical protein
MKKLSLVLVVFGILAALFGISAEEWKAFIVGVVLIFGSGVLATLSLSIRGRID